MKASHTRTLRLLDLDQLTALGVEAPRYRDLLYQRTQEIGGAASFLGFDGLIAPSARYDCANVVIFLDNAAPGALEDARSVPVDWPGWIGKRR